MTLDLTPAEVAALKALAQPVATPRTPGGQVFVPMRPPTPTRPTTREGIEASVYDGGGCAWCGRKVTAHGETIAAVGRRVTLDHRYHLCDRCSIPETRQSDLYDALVTAVGRVVVDPVDVETAIVALGAAWSSFTTPKMPGNRARWSHVTDWPLVAQVAQRHALERQERIAAAERMRCDQCSTPLRYDHPRLSPGSTIDGKLLCQPCAERAAAELDRERRAQVRARHDAATSAKLTLHRL